MHGRPSTRGCVANPTCRLPTVACRHPHAPRAAMPTAPLPAGGADSEQLRAELVALDRAVLGLALERTVQASVRALPAVDTPPSAAARRRSSTLRPAPAITALCRVALCCDCVAEPACQGGPRIPHGSTPALPCAAAQPVPGGGRRGAVCAHAAPRAGRRQGRRQGGRAGAASQGGGRGACQVPGRTRVDAGGRCPCMRCVVWSARALQAGRATAHGPSPAPQAACSPTPLPRPQAADPPPPCRCGCTTPWWPTPWS